MRANVLTDFQQMELMQLPVPNATKNCAVIKMRYAGVCGSDVTVFSGKHPTATVPVVIGHEILGTIAALSEEGTAAGFRVGDRVTVNPLISCGSCGACRSGFSHVCRNLKLLGIHENGGYAEYTCASVDKLVKIPDSLCDETAALAEPFAVGAHVTARAGVQPGDKVLVIGGGPIGIVVALCAAHLGADVTISEPNKKRRELAQGLGIRCLDPVSQDLAAVTAELTGEGFDVVCEASGSRPGILAATDVCRVRGTIVPMSLSGEPAAFCLGKVSFKELSVVGSRVYTPEHFRLGVRMLSEIDRQINLRSLVSDILPLEEARQAIQMMLDGSNAGKILIRCEA